MLFNKIFFLKTEKESSGFFLKNNFFLLFKLNNKDLIYKDRIIDDFKKKIEEFISLKKKLKSLKNFNDFINSFIRENISFADFSCSVGYLYENIFYLKTINQGKIYLIRKNKLVLIIEGNKIASGIIEDMDLFIFTSDNFFNLFENNRDLETIIKNNNSELIIKEFDNFLLKNQQKEISLLFINFFKKESARSSNKSSYLNERINKINYFFNEKFKNYFLIIKAKKKILTLFIAILFLIILFWSATGAVKRRQISLFEREVDKKRDLIYQKIQMAEEVVFLSADRSLILFNESLDELNNLKKQEKKLKINSRKLRELENFLKGKEKKIFKKEKAEMMEFFDLAIDNKNSSADKAYLFDNIVYILDKKNGVIYGFDLDQKSLEKIESEKIKKSNLIAGNKDILFFYVENDGVYQSKNFDKPKKIISYDEDWGEIIDMIVYNKNIYLLDRKKDELWKYLPSEKGFSQKNSYFSKGHSIDLNLVNSFAIDGSVYFLEEKNIYKYISGVRENFNFDLPSKNFYFYKIFTDNKTEKIYILDRKNSIIYVLTKTGEYVEQINVDTSLKLNDFFVYNSKIYVLSNSKIYLIKN